MSCLSNVPLEVLEWKVTSLTLCSLQIPALQVKKSELAAVNQSLAGQTPHIKGGGSGDHASPPSYKYGGEGLAVLYMECSNRAPLAGSID